MNGLRVVTNSELTTRRRCPREHYFAYIQGYRAVDDVDEFRFGTAWHVGMEWWWAARPLHECVDAMIEGIEDPFERAKLRVLMHGYDARWRPETNFADVVAIEAEFRAPFINPATGAASRTFVRGGKLDVRMGRSFVEHKTTSEDIGLGSVYWSVLKLNTQVSTYYAGLKQLGHECNGCLYDVVRKPGIRPSQVPLVDADGVKIVHDANGERVRTKDDKKWRQTADTALGYVLQTRAETPDEYEERLIDNVAENPDRYYQRGEVVRLEAEEYAANLDSWHQLRQLRDDELADRHPRNPDSCKRYGRLCPYFRVCCGEDRLQNPASFVKLDNVHPELSAGLG
jgi:hypothetical protein